MRKYFVLASFFLFSVMVLAQPMKIVFMTPTGEIQDKLPVFRVMEVSNPLYRKLNAQFSKGFLAESIKLHGFVQNYLLNSGRTLKVEPVYLAITENVGGYANYGFVLQNSNWQQIKDKSYYIDLHHNMIIADGAALSSYTQIFPHELGHVMLKLLTNSSDTNDIAVNPVVHYFSTPTDYYTAFSEGFAEHFEPTSVHFEPDQRIRRGVADDLKKLDRGNTKRLHGFDRDYSWPLRMGYYRATMPFWFQKLENFKRHKFVENGLGIFKPRFRNISMEGKKAMLYRNTSIWPDLRMVRNAAEAESTEGIISSFFYKMMQSDVRKQYYSEGLYQNFAPDTASHFMESIIPLENQYIKVFYVMANYVRNSETGRSQIIDFIEGYVKEFPADNEMIKQMWTQVSGHEYSAEMKPEVWVMNQDSKSYPWVMSQFGPTLPYFVFNLNSADTVHLLSFNGLNEEIAGKIISWRETNGPFYSLDQIREIPGIPADLANTLVGSGLDKEKLNNHSYKASMTSLIIYPLWHIFKMSLLWFAILGALYFIALRQKKEFVKPMRFVMLFLKMFLLAVIGVICMVITKPIMTFGIIVGLILLIQAVIYRKNLFKLSLHTIISLIMVLIVAYSMY
ncbi:MAG: helix-hairpin-helix domain-containing protein [Bacteroidales bacterium]|nr:helix-hairpin-helix domain-containing protein [Bacteroidales bacterium]